MQASPILQPMPPSLQLNNANMRTITRRQRNYEGPILSDLRNKILVFDTETTGFMSTRIVQIAYCKYYKSGVNYSQHSHYVRQLSDAELISLIKSAKPELTDMAGIRKELTKARYSEKEAQKIHQIPYEIIIIASDE